MKCQHNVKRLPQNQAFRLQRSDSLVEGLLDGKTSQCKYTISVNELAGAVRPDQSAKSICQEITEVQPGPKTTHYFFSSPLCHSGAVRLSFPPHGAKPRSVRNEEKQRNKRWTRKGRELVERV